MAKEILQVASLIISLGLSFVNDGNYRPEQKLALEEINWEAYQHVMTEEEYLALQEYLPVLTNEGSFIYTQYIYDQYDDIADVVKEEITIAEYIDGLYADLEEAAAANPINAIKVRGVAFCDIDDDEIYEMILYLSFLGSHFVVFDQDNGIIYGVDKYVRTFEVLQTNGIYIGSGGAGNDYYYQYHFVDANFTGTYLGHTHRDDEHHRLLYYIGEEQVDEETFEAWKSSIMVGDVEFYAPSR